MIDSWIVFVCLVVYSDCRWNCVRVQQFIVIVGGIFGVFISS